MVNMMRTLGSIIRFIVAYAVVAMSSFPFALGLFLLLPSRMLRISYANLYGHLVGRFVVWIMKCRIHIQHRERLNPDEVVIFVSNHTSMIDVFIIMWLVPSRTVSIAKKQVIYYPFFGQAFFLAGQVLVDRKGKGKGIRTLQRLGRFLKRNKVNVVVWPEGTRSKDGLLKPFKKGFAHLAIQTGMPVVPIVLENAYTFFDKQRWQLTGNEIKIRILDKIPSKEWQDKPLEDFVRHVHQHFVVSDDTPNE